MKWFEQTSSYPAEMKGCWGSGRASFYSTLCSAQLWCVFPHIPWAAVKSQSSVSLMGHKWMHGGKCSKKQQRNRGEVGMEENNTAASETGLLGSALGHPQMFIHLTEEFLMCATKFVWAPYYGLVVHICASNHSFHIHILQSDLAQLLCAVKRRPLAQGPRWILCPALSVDYRKVTLEQAWYCYRKRPCVALPR